jgi:hypothetical protein
VTSSSVCEIIFELVRHEFKRIFNVSRDLRATNMVLGLPWLDDEQASLRFGTTRVVTLKDGNAVETRVEERRSYCFSMSFRRVQSLMRKTRRSK